MTVSGRHNQIFLMGLGCYLALLFLYWRYGYIHLDGGYYVSAGYGVAHGSLPYRDFFFPQGPIYPYVYGLFHFFFGSTVQSTRFLSLLFAVLLFVLVHRVTLKWAGTFAATVAIVLLGLNPFFCYHLVVEKLNALAALFLLGGSILFMLKHNRTILHGSLTLFSLAVTTRYTLLPVLVPVYLWLIWQQRRTPLKLVGPFLLQLIIVTGITAPFLIECPDQFLYGIIGVHVSASTGSTYHFGLLNKLAALSQLAKYATLLLFATAPLIISLFFRETRKIVIPGQKELVLWAGLGLISLAHFSANWFHASYQIPLIPLWIMLVSLGLTRLMASLDQTRLWQPVLITLACGGVLTVLAYSPDFIWTSEGAIKSPFLEDVTGEVHRFSGPHDLILTEQPLIAHQAGRKILPGFEGAPFTYTPFWDTARCVQFSTVNDEMLEEILRNHRARLLVLGVEAFRLASPGFVLVEQERFEKTWRLIHSYYQPVAEIPDFAGTGDTLTFYIPRH